MGRLLWACAVLIIAGFVLAGCGGGGGGNGNDNGGDPSNSLVGLWQPISATEDGTPVKVSVAMYWDEDWSYGRIEFRQNGTCSILGYQGSMTVREDGTWSSDQGVAQVTFEEETTVITWSNIGNLMTISFSRDGHDYETKWVRITNLTKRDANLAKTWAVDNVKINGIDEDPANFFVFRPGSDRFIIQLLSNGEMILRELNGNDIVSRDVGSWASDNYVIKMVHSGEGDEGDLEFWGYPGSNSITFFDVGGNGDTVTFELSVLPPAGYRDPNIVGAWIASSATVDDVPTPLPEALGWDPGITSFGFQLWGDGTYETNEYSGSTVTGAWLGDWDTIGNQLTLNLGIPLTGIYALSGGNNSLTVNYLQGGHDIAVKFNKVIYAL